VDVKDLIKQFVGDDPNSGEKSNTFAETFMANFTGDNIAECPICFSEREAPVFYPWVYPSIVCLFVKLNPLLVNECCLLSCKDCSISHIGICEERGQ